MRWDITGLFWDDYVAPKIPVEKVKREPPKPVWLEDDYLPGLEQARAYRFDYMTDNEIFEAQRKRERLAWDCEFYPNYALLGFRHIDTGKVIAHEFTSGETLPLFDKFKWILDNFTIVGFNDTLFDIPMAAAAMSGLAPDQLIDCVRDLIFNNYNSWSLGREFYKARKITRPIVDNIDLIELTPLGPSLKKCAARMGAKRLADLPFKPEKNLSPDQRTILKWYWANDLENTANLYLEHVRHNALPLRELLTEEYKVDVRSKSDPQIAEAVIRTEIKRITGQQYFSKAEIQEGRSFKYRPPSFLRFTTPLMRNVLGFVSSQNFFIDTWGSPMMPPELERLDITIGDAVYRMGIGGLHSKEKRTVHFSDAQFELTDNDVTSYYPSLILKEGMYPPHVGPIFLEVFKRIYDRRIAAKKSGDKETAETLKIVLNGTFGKTGERGGHSVVYYPEMMIQVTLTGQLALLLLIEQLELAGISVVSANTDGIVIKCPRSLIETKKQIMAWWEEISGLGLESVEYAAIYSRDVNNYIAIYKQPQKGELAKRIGAYRKVVGTYPLKWNPTCEICSDAVVEFLAKGTPIEQTIRACTDMRKFVEVREARKGAVKDGEYLGKTIRWYYATGVTSEIINAENGYVIPRSLGARPCMILPETLPEDLDYAYYVTRAEKILEDFAPKKQKAKKAA